MYSIWHIWFFRQIIKIQYWISAQLSKVKESSLSSNPLGTIYSGRFFRDAVIIFHSVPLPREQQRRRSFINSYIILTIWPQLLAQFNTTRRASLHFNAYNNTTLCHHVAGCWLKATHSGHCGGTEQYLKIICSMMSWMCDCCRGTHARRA